MSGWRIVTAQEGGDLSLDNGQIVVEKGEEKKCIPLDPVMALLVASPRGSISLPLLAALAEANIGVTLCDAKHNPCALVVPLGAKNNGAACVQMQAAWTQEAKDAVWAEIVACKLKMQAAMLDRAGLEVPAEFRAYQENIKPGDSSNREGQAARLYFHALFSKRFMRHADDDINAAMNYGYVILTSAATRMLTAHGWYTPLGIHHKGAENHFNLSCDIMEPFRPFVDAIVWEAKGAEFNWDLKKKLIAVLQAPCRYGEQTMTLENAMEYFALAVIKKVNGEECTIKEVSFG